MEESIQKQIQDMIAKEVAKVKSEFQQKITEQIQQNPLETISINDLCSQIEQQVKQNVQQSIQTLIVQQTTEQKQSSQENESSQIDTLSQSLNLESQNNENQQNQQMLSSIFQEEQNTQGSDQIETIIKQLVKKVEAEYESEIDQTKFLFAKPKAKKQNKQISVKQEIPKIEEITLNEPEYILDSELVKIGFVSCLIKQQDANNKEVNQIIIESFMGTPVLNLDQYITLESGKVLGKIDDVIGPVTMPFYSVFLFPKINENEIVMQETMVYCPINRLQLIDRNQLLQSQPKASDASNKYDQEIPEHLQEFSDDEEERINKKKRRREPGQIIENETTSKKQQDKQKKQNTKKENPSFTSEYQIVNKETGESNKSNYKFF